jgi:hypothetical protein
LTDATSDAGLTTVASPAATGKPDQAVALAVGDVDGDGTDDLFASSRLYRVQTGFVRDVTERSGISLPHGATYATFADYDNDGWLDLFAIGGDGRGYLFRNRGNGTFVEGAAKAGVSDLKGARKAIFADLDHDGDLDLLLVSGAQPIVYRNNLDGTFTEATVAFSLARASDARDAVFGDFDNDGRTDIFFTSERGSNSLMQNRGAQRFREAASGLATSGGSGDAAVADYNNDGFLDLLVESATGGDATLWLNKGNGTFTRDARSSVKTGLSLTFVDYDNDGWLDIVSGGKATISFGRR